MNNGWRDVALGDHVDLVTGFPFKSVHFLDKSDGAVRLLRGDNVGQGALRWDGAKHWPKQQATEYGQFFLEERDVILAMDRPWIEAGLKYAWVRRSDMPCLLVQRVARLRGINGLSTDYLRYVIASQEFTGHVNSITTGVNVPHISATDIKQFRFRLPPQADQQRIVSILGAYDDLIEVNRRRIALLEEMTRRLFDEWFVHLRFPGNDDHVITETPSHCTERGGASLPMNDWRDLKLGDVLALQRGFDITRANQRPGVIPVVSSSGIGSYHDEAMVQGPGVVIGRKGSLGTCFFLNRAFWPHDTTLWVKDFKGNDPYFCYFLLKSMDLAKFDVGAANPTLNRNHLAGIRLRVPPKTVQRRFQELVEPMFDTSEILHMQNSALVSSRDQLLPRLISGELSDAAADAELGAVA